MASLHELTDRDAVLAAIKECDELGRDKFLERYGFRPARTYFLVHNDNRYDSKAIAGVAYGKQHPEHGPLRSTEFSGGEHTVRMRLEALGFKFTLERDRATASLISAKDIEHFAEARKSGTTFAQLSADQRNAYARVHSALQELGQHALQELGGAAEYTLKLTSRFSPQGGVSGSVPKDLWFGVYATENKGPFVGNPQLFMIVSDKGVEYGFGASTHPSDFSDASIKEKVRGAAPKIFDLLPDPDGPLAKRLGREVDLGSGWRFRRKARLGPGGSDFADIHDWLTYMKSPEGKAQAGGGIYRHLTGRELDGADLFDDMSEAARIFAPLMESVRATSAIATSVPQESFSKLIEKALNEFAVARKGPMEAVKPLWDAMGQVVAKLENFPAVRSRSHIIVRWSLGKGVWAKIPWIALLNVNVTTTTQKGLYVVFLVSEDLSKIYLNLAQGVTEYLNQYPAAAAGTALEQKAAQIRKHVGQLSATGFTLSNSIDLRSEGTLAKNYQKGTIAHAEFATDRLPDDDAINAYLESILSAYDIEAANAGQPIVESEPEDVSTHVEYPPCSVADAMEDLFLEPEYFEKILDAWRSKKNVVLQGAPGVGKSFVARRLAYALIGRQDPTRVETVQFHQSYGYEDFVQGFRPTAGGGFDLKDGLFHRFCSEALRHPEQDYVLIIDEINRGNLSKIFGELMLLIEADKRSPDWAVRLAYAKETDSKFHVPENLYIIGMMNTADRSLSMVDYALRRRFAFFTLEPQFHTAAFGQNLVNKNVPERVVADLVAKMTQLNDVIAGDKVNLGPGFRIGHSFFVPHSKVTHPESWVDRVMETEILPLLEEYWFDDQTKVESSYEQLRS